MLSNKKLRRLVTIWKVLFLCSPEDFTLKRWLVRPLQSKRTFVDPVTYCVNWKVFLRPYRDIHHRIRMFFLMQHHLKGQRSQAFSLVFSLAPFHTEIPLDSLTLWIILWTEDGQISIFFAITEGMLFINCSTICSCSLYKVENIMPL